MEPVPWHSYGVSLAIWDHIPAILHKWTHPALTPARQAGTRFTYPGGMEGWVDLVDLIAPRPGVEPATFRSRVRRLTAARPRQPRWLGRQRWSLQLEGDAVPTAMSPGPTQQSLADRCSCYSSLRLGALWLLCFNGAGYKHPYLLTYYLYATRRVSRCLPTAAAKRGNTRQSGGTAPEREGIWRWSTTMANLKAIRWCTGSQWSWRRTVLAKRIDRYHYVQVTSFVPPRSNGGLEKNSIIMHQADCRNADIDRNNRLLHGMDGYCTDQRTDWKNCTGTGVCDFESPLLLIISNYFYSYKYTVSHKKLTPFLLLQQLCLILTNFHNF